MEETITHLEMTSPDQLRPARPVAAVALERVEAGSPQIRPTMERIAAPHHWPSRSWLDHPNALPNYRSRGFRLFHTEVRKRDLPA